MNKDLKLGAEVITPQGNGIIIGFGECVGWLKVQLHSGRNRVLEFMDVELKLR